MASIYILANKRRKSRWRNLKQSSELLTNGEKKNIKTFLLNLNKTSDKDVIEQLEKQPSKNGYIKELIRNDIDKNKLQNLINK